MKKRKQNWAIVLLVTMMATLLGGCAWNKENKQESIFKGNPNAMRIFVRENSTYADRLVEQFPDIDFDFYYYGGMNTTMMMNQLLEEDDLGDIFFSSLQVKDDVAKKHMLNLSGYGICGRYESSILSQFDVDGNIYQLPGYVTMRSILYNKDMFEAHGWEEPKNFEELVALCARIREETEGITPIVMGAAAGGYYFTTMTSYAQAEFLYTPEGEIWTELYQQGKASSEEGFGEGIEMVQQLIDANAFDHEKNVGLWDNGLFAQRMVTGEAAMMFAWGGQTMIVKQMMEHPEMHFGIMPFRNRNGQAFIGTNIPYYIGLPKELGEKGNEKKLKNAMRIIDWLSTEEGVASLSTDTLAAVLPIKNAKNENVYDIYRNFWNENLDSIKAPMLYAGYEDIIIPVADRMIEAVEEHGRLDDLPEVIDETHREYLKGGVQAIEVGHFGENFTHLETVQMLAHILQKQGGSDIALVSDGAYRNGVLNYGGVFAQFLEGPILDDYLTCCIPGSSINDMAVQMTLTGKQVKHLLENGKHCVLYEDSYKPYPIECEDNAIASASFDYYWAGMDVKWKKGKVESMTLDDGTVLSDDKTCTVTFAPSDYTEETGRVGNPTEFSYTVRDLLEKYIKKNSPVHPVPVLR